MCLQCSTSAALWVTRMPCLTELVPAQPHTAITNNIMATHRITDPSLERRCLERYVRAIWSGVIALTALRAARYGLAIAQPSSTADSLLGNALRNNETCRMRTLRAR